eukprot:TRINITY_DN898_c0_g1_i1.p2 TRINITY_DN898_c0_g1~~TRINITY_DN898_c0_g1_i1.p2  ORF type:complete len:365 (-),score=88.52 TRINITY_DN898_c0_g1_i1:469-1563(-)
MLHSLKKRAFRLQVPLNVALTPDSESVYLRHQLRQIRQQLQHLLRVHHSAGALWLRLLHNQRNFSERIHLAYPNHDQLARICEQLRAETARLSTQFAREQRPLSPVLAHIREQIESYVRQIVAVEAMYAHVDSLHSEYNRYKQKVDSLVTNGHEHRVSPRKRGSDDTRKSRNFSKLDRAEEEHKRALAELLQRQRKVFAVHAPLFHAALVAFWLSHASCVDELVLSLQQARRFAESQQEKMHALDVKELVEHADGDTPVSAHTGLSESALKGSGEQREKNAAAAARSISGSGVMGARSRSSSAHTAAQMGVSPSVDIREVHHIISRASLSGEDGTSGAEQAEALKEGAADGRSELSPTAIQQIQ